MEDINEALIERLVVEDLAGVISEADKLYLQHIIQVNPQALAIWREKRAVLCTPEVQAFMDRSPSADTILATIRRRKRWRITKAVLAAAALLVTGLCLFYFNRPAPPAPAPMVNNKHIRLQLPGGELVDLSGQQGAVTTGSVNLHNSNKSLTYTTGTPTLKLATLSVPPGKDYKVRLSDSTEVWLNATTTLQFPLTFMGNTREITINGEAYLKVTKDTRPFLVHLPNSTVQVLGTEFNVNTYDPGKVQVALVTGAVSMKTLKDSLLLKPGFEATYTANGIRVAAFDADHLLWRQGKYLFNNTPLSEVLQVLPRWFGMEVVIDNNARSNMRFTGLIDRNQPIGQSLDLLKATNTFDYYIEGETIHIK